MCVPACESAQHDVHQSQAGSIHGCVLYIVEVMISWTVDPVTVSSDSYPAAPDFVRPDSDNLRQGLLQQHLRTQKIISGFIRA